MFNYVNPSVLFGKGRTVALDLNSTAKSMEQSNINAEESFTSEFRDMGDPTGRISSAKTEIEELIRVNPAIIFSDSKDDFSREAKRVCIYLYKL